MTSTAGSGRSRDAAFFATTGLVFLASAVATVLLCRSMSGSGMPMPGRWTMSMSWMKMPNQTWPVAAATFVGSWLVMMVAMMLPALVAMLSQYRRAARSALGEPRLGRTTALVGAGYFLPWLLVGVIVYPLGVAAAVAAMRWPFVSRLVPAATGLLVMLAALVQLTPWKAHQLACCRNPPAVASLPAGGLGACRHGITLGVRCALCCASFTTVLLALGVMDLTTMALVAVGITFERVAPWPVPAARLAGITALAAGTLFVGSALLGG